MSLVTVTVQVVSQSAAGGDLKQRTGGIIGSALSSYSVEIPVGGLSSRLIVPRIIARYLPSGDQSKSKIRPDVKFVICLARRFDIVVSRPLEMTLV